VSSPHADLEDFRGASAAFDIVVSRMALLYVERLEPVLASARRTLVPGGRFLFTVVHP
jgi:predicted TPR repeat methyltransferase